MSEHKARDSQIARSSSLRQRALADRSEALKGKVLSGARVYLSGPMDFVASREEEKKNGWRNRISQFLSQFGTTVFDPWNKPSVAGMPHYGEESVDSNKARDKWTFEDSERGDRKRAKLSEHFWPTLHIDLRMVDTSDFLVAYCPTNIYSVGTVHEIVMARLQSKPVLFVSPRIKYPALDNLKQHLADNNDQRGQELLKELLKNELPVRPNPGAIPSMWYMALIDGHYFFDGFGFAAYMERFGWERGGLDEREEEFPPQRPLLPYLEKLSQEIPKKYDFGQSTYIENADWLIFEQKKTN
jgi:hypothetical protein